MNKKESNQLLSIMRHAGSKLLDWDRTKAVAFNELPLRSELYTVQQLELHARTLAKSHETDVRGGRNELLLRLRENEKILFQTYELIREATAQKRRISPASEWMLDNFYLIEEHIRTTRRHLPRGYSRELPRVVNGTTGIPRVYTIALELISHVDGKIDHSNISHFVAAYQAVSELKLGELWAIPIMLRLALIENLRRVAVRIAIGQADRDTAKVWADRLVRTAERTPADVILVVADMARARLSYSSAFVAELSRQLQGQNQNFSMTLAWIEQRLAQQSMTREQMIHDESQNQAADQVSIGNSIGSLRTLDAIDWREFVESASTVEHILRSDPVGVYAGMDFATRDRYRHVVELTARRCKLSEAEVAQCAVNCALNRSATQNGDFKKHVGYYLVDKGYAELEAAAQTSNPINIKLGKVLHENSLLTYVGAILVIAAWFIFGSLKTIWPFAGLNRYEVAGLLAAIAVASSQFSMTLVNWLMTLFVPPRRMPRLDCSSGITPENRTVVAVPVMLTSRESIEDLAGKLEVRYLGNQDPSLHFALLTDFRDADSETLPNDDELLKHAAECIDALNRRYAGGQNNIFYLFHRPRRWNPSDRKWMGYERKRGKLADFNHFLLHGATERFSRIAGDPAALAKVRYVIALDSDTQLPRDSAQELVAAMAHPLNAPHYDAALGRVTRGYTILQPSAAITLPSTQRSMFAQLFSGEPGIDPYTQVISDIYQDLFDEGSFIGKGIYDLKSFEQTLNERLPENRILSHDLLEGSYVRAGLVSDIQIFEDYPSRYLADVARRHRWIRGDWQIMRWLLPSVPGLKKRMKNPLSMLSRLKIFDNLRRCMVPVAVCVALAAGWLLLPTQAALVWTLWVLSVPLLPLALDMFCQLCMNQQAASVDQHLQLFARKFATSGARSILGLAMLPHEAAVSLDATIRTLYRLTISRRHLLEWTTASESEQSASTSLSGILKAMWAGPLFAAGLGTALVMLAPETLPAAAPLLGLWFASPFFALLISRPISKRPSKMTNDDIRFLRRTARRTWSFFERFVTPEENWMPPDNYQEYPVGVIAHRTSPTNLGMSLLANLAAYDLGYISVRELLARTKPSLESMEKLDRYRGHFYNWYDTLTMRPLAPLYVSTVDSGNLAGHLLTLRQGLFELPDEPVLSSRAFAGLNDTLDVLHEKIDALHGDSTVNAQIHGEISHLRALLSENASNPLSKTMQLLEVISQTASRLVDVPDIALDSELKSAAQALVRHAEDIKNSVIYWMPWLAAPVPSDERALRFLPGFPAYGQGSAALTAAGAAPLIPTIRQLAGLGGSIKAGLETYIAAQEKDGRDTAALRLAQQQLGESASRSTALISEIEALAGQCQDFASMDFTFLYNASRKLFTIGFNVADHRLDQSCYDLLASEARLTSYLAIAQGQVEQEHWFAMGRQIAGSGGAPTLISWSGSMFEYLMPLLVMPNYENTLLDQTYIGTVERQIEYGRKAGVPWGISESGYNLTDAHLNYQYRAFGVPGLGLKRGLSEDLVIAPYACVMALMVDPESSCRNLKQLARENRTGLYGFYEAIDYTPSRIPRGQQSVPVRSFMAHHEGMSLLAMDFFLAGQPMQRRFMSEPLFKVADLLLHERVPKGISPVLANADNNSHNRLTETGSDGILRVVADPSLPVPDVHLLSNGRYHVMIDSAGSGYSRWKDISVTRWREDAMCNNYGVFCYVRDLDSGEVWSNSFQPALRAAKAYEAIFTQGKAEFRRSDFEIDIHTEISVSAEDDVEVRRLSITNRSNRPRTLELTSFGEIVIAPASADAAHPAFSNLFVQTQIFENRHAIVATRRPRSAGDQPPCLMHTLCVRSHESGKTSFETDRSVFIGRGNTVVNPIVFRNAGLSGSKGSVLDPVVSIRRGIRLEPMDSVQVDLVCGIAENVEQASILIDKYGEQRLADRVFEMAWTHSQVALRQLNATESDAQLYSRLAGSIVFASRYRRASTAILTKNRRGQSGLWSYGISGDLPIIMLRIKDAEKIELVRQIVQAHAYWRMKGLIVDLVITNDDSSVYRQALFDQIMLMIAAGGQAQMLDKPGGIFVRRAEQISDEDRILLQTVARVVLSDSDGTLKEQVERRPQLEAASPKLRPLMDRRAISRPEAYDAPPPALKASDLQFFNGIGGFSKDGKEYCILLDGKKTTPAPWVNVLANPYFGTVISESGGAYTWLENSHEYRLTPWNNDPVSDSGGEAFYIRDEENGEFWSPTPLPVRGSAPYTIRHGFGYSVFESIQKGIACEFTTYVATDAPVKFMQIKLRNISRRSRRLALSGYIEWVMGEFRFKNQMHVITEEDRASGAILARNPFSSEFPGRIAFLAVTERNRTVTGDRGEFIGRNGNLSRPAAMQNARLSGRLGAGLDPCAAMQVPINLAPGQDCEIVFELGVGRDNDDVMQLLERFCNLEGARSALKMVHESWQNTLGAVQVKTPDRALDLLANGWLLYQTLSCRMWARSGFYQSGGAYGFRDQLQDSMALVYSQPVLIREHLLRAARHQFKEGDVQHWWHPPAGRGVRTHFSDDYLWLPYVACRFVQVTGDTGVLDERIPFIEGRTVNADEEAYYDLPLPSEGSATLYTHCQRAIERGLRFGEHGLPLMGCGDWNDGMNRVGAHGKGESVWLAFFLYDVLTQFSKIARDREDLAFSEKCLQQAAAMKKNIEANAWDGGWYRRAYFDDGQPLGSAQNTECQIDALPQSWSVLSGAGDPTRSADAMDAVDRRLVKRDSRLIQLFDPPFDHSSMDPGYIQGYVPGVRENGGQYTHAAVWTVMAYAKLGMNRRAWELFSMINPVNHGATAQDIAVYKVEPYVVAADVYAVTPHTGRGGWTWYTGSAGWMYRLILESLLGLRVEKDMLRIESCVPPEWGEFSLSYRYRNTTYEILVKIGAGKKPRIWLDGREQDDFVAMVDDGTPHKVVIGE